MGPVSVRPKTNYILLSSYIFLQLKINITPQCAYGRTKSTVSFEKNYKYPVFIFSIFLFRFVLTSQFFRDLENTFQAQCTMTACPFTVIKEKVVVQILFDCLAYS